MAGVMAGLMTVVMTGVIFDDFVWGDTLSLKCKYVTIHLRRWQIYAIFDPSHPLVGKFVQFFTPSLLKNADVLNGWSLYLWWSLVREISLILNSAPPNSPMDTKQTPQQTPNNTPTDIIQSPINLQQPLNKTNSYKSIL